MCQLPLVLSLLLKRAWLHLLCILPSGIYIDWWHPFKPLHLQLQQSSSFACWVWLTKSILWTGVNVWQPGCMTAGGSLVQLLGTKPECKSPLEWLQVLALAWCRGWCHCATPLKRVLRHLCSPPRSGLWAGGPHRTEPQKESVFHRSSYRANVQFLQHFLSFNSSYLFTQLAEKCIIYFLPEKRCCVAKKCVL